jgi:hypothetical protein
MSETADIEALARAAWVERNGRDNWEVVSEALRDLWRKSIAQNIEDRKDPRLAAIMDFWIDNQDGMSIQLDAEAARELLAAIDAAS